MLVFNKIRQNKHIDRYFNDAVFKANVGLFCSFGINLIYVAVNAISGYIYQSSWFAIFAVYYGIIAIIRLLLVCYVKNNDIGECYINELKRARLCSYILLTVNLALTGVVLMMTFFDKGFEYQGFMIYAIALYTFYITIAAIVDMIRYRKYNSPILSSIKIVKMTSALFSMLFLETAMFAQFGSDTSSDLKHSMIMATGGIIGIVVVCISLYMITKTSNKIREIRKGL